MVELDILRTDATLELVYNRIQAFLGKASDGTQLLLARTQQQSLV